METVWAILKAFFYFLLSVVLCTTIGFFSGSFLAEYFAVYDAAKAGPVFGMLIGLTVGVFIGFELAALSRSNP